MKLQQEKTPPQEHQEQQSQNTERQTKHKENTKTAGRQHSVCLHRIPKRAPSEKEEEEY
jgi:hypothetical protein